MPQTSQVRSSRYPKTEWDKTHFYTTVSSKLKWVSRESRTNICFVIREGFGWQWKRRFIQDKIIKVLIAVPHNTALRYKNITS